MPAEIQSNEGLRNVRFDLQGIPRHVEEFHGPRERAQARVDEHAQPAAGYKFPVKSCKLQAAGYKLQATSYKLQVTSTMQVFGERASPQQIDMR